MSQYETYYVYKVEVSASPMVPVPKFETSTDFIVARNEQDARDSFNCSITMCAGSCIRILSVECLGPCSIIDDETKSHWRYPREISSSTYNEAEEDDGA